MNAKRKILEKIVRVDQAGEVGAQQIYEGQKLVFKTLKNKKDFDQISRMAGEEKEHLDYFNELAKKSLLNLLNYQTYLELVLLQWALVPPSWVEKLHMFVQRR